MPRGEYSSCAALRLVLLLASRGTLSFVDERERIMWKSMNHLLVAASIPWLTLSVWAMGQVPAEIKTSREGTESRFLLGDDGIVFDIIPTEEKDPAEVKDLPSIPDTLGIGSWNLQGNFVDFSHFLGTTNNVALNFRVNNQRVLRLEPNAVAPNILGGFSGNTVTAGVIGATIGGGGRIDDRVGDPDNNRVTDDFGTVGGGRGNQAGDAAGMTDDQFYATVAGGQFNTAGGDSSAVGGGGFNICNGRLATVAGGRENVASGVGSTVGGGFFNTASGGASTIGGGQKNTSTSESEFCTIGGGFENTVRGLVSTVGGGDSNTANGNWSAVGGGNFNIAIGAQSTVAGGQFNTANGISATVGGGGGRGFIDPIGNTASGDYSTVPGGSDNQAGGDHSFSAGRHAKVRNTSQSGDADGDEGTFAWADSAAADFVSTGPNQFLVRASGGVYFGTNSVVSIPAGRFINTSTDAHLTTGGMWTNASDRNAKENIRPIDPAHVLEQVLSMPVSRWSYRAESECIEHIGPMAQDFHAAFGTGDSDKAIGTVDADGVALAAIQGLHQLVEQSHRRLAEKDRRIEELEARMVKLEATVGSMTKR